MAVGVVLLLAVLALLAPPALSSASAQRATPTATIVQQAALLKQGKWRAMYATFTARFQTVAAVTFQHRDVAGTFSTAPASRRE